MSLFLMRLVAVSYTDLVLAALALLALLVSLGK